MFKSGYVAIVGMPNVGKSTLLNAMLGEKLSIVTDKPQTTRHRIVGILHRKGAQILFLDTPGIHQSKKLLNEVIVKTALNSLADADVVLHLILPKPNLSNDDLQIAQAIKESGRPYIVIVNKIDLVAKDSLLPLIQKVQKLLAPDEIIPVSAQAAEGLDVVIKSLIQKLPEGPEYYPTDMYTEHDLRFLAAEIVREKAMLFLHQELPYSLATQVEDFKEEKKVPHIHVAIVVEKPSQKGMVIGAKGAMIKRIGELARKDIEAIVGKKVFLELFVKVIENWTKNERHLKDLGIIS